MRPHVSDLLHFTNPKLSSPNIAFHSHLLVQHAIKTADSKVTCCQVAAVKLGAAEVGFTEPNQASNIEEPETQKENYKKTKM